MDKDFKRCRVCFEEEKHDSFMSVFDEGHQIRKIFGEKFGILFTHFMFNQRKALICVDCFERLTNNPSDEIIESARERAQKYHREHFSDAEKKFFHWGKKVEDDKDDSESDEDEIEDDFQPRKMTFAERVDVQKLFIEPHQERARTLPPAPKELHNIQPRSLRLQRRSARIETKHEDHAEMAGDSSYAFDSESAKCEICLKNFCSRSNRDRHMRTVHSINLPKSIANRPKGRRRRKGRETCPHCHKSFSKVREHIDTVHLGVLRYWCDLCGKGFYLKSRMRDHIEAHVRGTVRVNQSSIGTSNQLFEASAEDSKKKTCPHCFKAFTDVRRHIQTVHENISRYLCDICGRGSFDKYTMRKHIEAHAKGTINANKPLNSAGRLKKTCPHCHKFYLYLRYHINTVHLGILRYWCDFCGRGFYKKSTLRNHIEVHVKGTAKVNKPMKKGSKKTCPHCNKEYSQLRKHIDTVHLKLLRFTCDHCAKGFYRKYILRQHMKIHAKVREVYQCTVCTAKFLDEKSLKAHFKKHRKNRR